jgi:hypothetical protein
VTTQRAFHLHANVWAPTKFVHMYFGFCQDSGAYAAQQRLDRALQLVLGLGRLVGGKTESKVFGKTLCGNSKFGRDADLGYGVEINKAGGRVLC